jgi:hypothetical protein
MLTIPIIKSPVYSLCWGGVLWRLSGWNEASVADLPAGRSFSKTLVSKAFEVFRNLRLW